MISTKGRYALRIMADLAENDGETPVSVREIADRQEISEKYMEQILSLLVRAGLVRSVRGAQGGYHLIRSAEAITAGDILRATEGDLIPVQCIVPGAEGCGRAAPCPSQQVFRKLYAAMNGVLDHMTLSEMIAGGEEEA